MRTLSTLLLAVAVSAPTVALAGCVERGEVYAEADAYVPPPTLAYVGPGLWVVADYNEPIFYSDGYYWLYDDGFWYQSVGYADGWVAVDAAVLPPPVRRLDRPNAYVRYHPPRTARVRRGPPPDRAMIRDHREAARANRNRKSTEVYAHRAPLRSRDYGARPRTRDHRHR